jgi:arsenate reductase
MTAHWGFPDPAVFEGPEPEARAVFAQVYGQIERRIEIFLNLPLEALDRMSLQTKVREIGQTALDESQ